MFRDTPKWIELGDGAIVDAYQVTSVGIVFEPEEWMDREQRCTWDRGYRSTVSFPGGVMVSKRTAEDIGAEIKELTKPKSRD
jgi:hypothetical protein